VRNGLQPALVAARDCPTGHRASLVALASVRQKCGFRALLPHHNPAITGWRTHALAISMGGGVDARDSTRDEVALRAARNDRLNFACPTKYPKAVEKLSKDHDALLAFYDFPAEHWQHVRTTNPIESTFATVRHRTSRTRNCLSRATFLGMAFKLIEAAEQSWRKIRGADKIEPLLKGVAFKDGTPVIESTPAPQPLAA
ncbi:transposase, partial [Burkholderia sp. HI2714]|uniref:transposase n=1 Tax=Burkholderia sp. HI2714 TaxID=2015359 RepID=UPI00211AFE80